MCAPRATALLTQWRLPGPERDPQDARGDASKPIGADAMSLEEITLALFAACNSFRVVAYIPQLLKAANDKNGASLHLIHDLVPVPAGALVHGRLCAHQSL